MGAPYPRALSGQQASAIGTAWVVGLHLTGDQRVDEQKELIDELSWLAVYKGNTCFKETPMILSSKIRRCIFQNVMCRWRGNSLLILIKLLESPRLCGGV